MAGLIFLGLSGVHQVNFDVTVDALQRSGT